MMIGVLSFIEKPFNKHYLPSLFAFLVITSLPAVAELGKHEIKTNLHLLPKNAGLMGSG